MRRYLFPKSAALLWLLSGVLWTGCAASSARVVALAPPDLSCAPDPAVPAEGDPATVGAYILDLWAAGQSCRDAVGAYREWSQQIQHP